MSDALDLIRADAEYIAKRRDAGAHVDEMERDLYVRVLRAITSGEVKGQAARQLASAALIASPR